MHVITKKNGDSIGHVKFVVSGFPDEPGIYRPQLRTALSTFGGDVSNCLWLFILPEENANLFEIRFWVCA